MFHLLVFISSLIISQCVALGSRNDAVIARCLEDHNGTLTNDQLIGTWYEVTKFTLLGSSLPTRECNEVVITKPTEEVIDLVKRTYEELEPPYSFNDNPVHVSRYRNLFRGLLTGDGEAKYYFVIPTGFANAVTPKGYKYINDDYILVRECELRGSTIWLHSRINYPTAEEINEVVSQIDEVSNMVAQRFCVT